LCQTSKAPPMNKSRTVADVMTRNVMVATEEENLDRLAEGMERHRFRHLPVVDGKKLVGLLSQRDLALLAPSPIEPASTATGVAARLAQRTFVADVMTREVKTVSPETPLVEAVTLMIDHRLGCLPVVDTEGSLVGIVTRYDFLKLTRDLLNGN